jgi:hypothetical protein
MRGSTLRSVANFPKSCWILYPTLRIYLKTCGTCTQRWARTIYPKADGTVLKGDFICTHHGMGLYKTRLWIFPNGSVGLYPAVGCNCTQSGRGMFHTRVDLELICGVECTYRGVGTVQFVGFELYPPWCVACTHFEVGIVSTGVVRILPTGGGIP